MEQVDVEVADHRTGERHVHLQAGTTREVDDHARQRFVQRHINMCSMALSKRVLTMTGRLSFFRASVMTNPEFIKDVEA
ncbi:glycosyltransferase, partial [Klebsiella pneumoniae]